MKRQIMTDDPQWEKIYWETHQVRPYTQEERDVLNEEHVVGSVERLQQIVTRIKIDTLRYQAAAAENMDLAPHFDRLQEIGRQSIEGWRSYYAEYHNVIMPTVVPFDGTEDAYPTGLLRDATADVDMTRASLPA